MNDIVTVLAIISFCLILPGSVHMGGIPIRTKRMRNIVLYAVIAGGACTIASLLIGQYALGITYPAIVSLLLSVYSGFVLGWLYSRLTRSTTT